MDAGGSRSSSRPNKKRIFGRVVSSSLSRAGSLMHSRAHCAAHHAGHESTRVLIDKVPRSSARASNCYASSAPLQKHRPRLPRLPPLPRLPQLPPLPRLPVPRRCSCSCSYSFTTRWPDGQGQSRARIIALPVKFKFRYPSRGWKTSSTTAEDPAVQRITDHRPCHKG